jgi:hypothetical protein
LSIKPYTYVSGKTPYARFLDLNSYIDDLKNILTAESVQTHLSNNQILLNATKDIFSDLHLDDKHSVQELHNFPLKKHENLSKSLIIVHRKEDSVRIFFAMLSIVYTHPPISKKLVAKLIVVTYESYESYESLHQEHWYSRQ